MVVPCYVSRTKFTLQKFNEISFCLQLGFWVQAHSRTRHAVPLFRVFSNFHECFLNSTETKGTYFAFLLANSVTKERNHRSKILCKISFLAPSFRQQLVLVMCSHQLISTIPNQLARMVLVPILFYSVCNTLKYLYLSRIKRRKPCQGKQV